jgi:hypothetical protein
MQIPVKHEVQHMFSQHSLSTASPHTMKVKQVPQSSFSVEQSMKVHADTFTGEAQAVSSISANR